MNGEQCGVGDLRLQFIREHLAAGQIICIDKWFDAKIHLVETHLDAVCIVRSVEFGMADEQPLFVDTLELSGRCFQQGPPTEIRQQQQQVILRVDALQIGWPLIRPNCVSTREAVQLVNGWVERNDDEFVFLAAPGEIVAEFLDPVGPCPVGQSPRQMRAADGHDDIVFRFVEIDGPRRSRRGRERLVADKNRNTNASVRASILGIVKMLGQTVCNRQTVSIVRRPNYVKSNYVQIQTRSLESCARGKGSLNSVARYVLDDNILFKKLNDPQGE